METRSGTQSIETAKLRILIVDNDPSIRERHRNLVELWGYTPIVVEGEGDTLLENARKLAREHRCQIALVDVRLRDEQDRGDHSGLELTPQLHPTAVIIVSGPADRGAAVAALTRYGAVDFVGKEDGPEALHIAIDELAKRLGIGAYRPQIVWSHGLSSSNIRDLMFPKRPDIPTDETDELIGLVFKDRRSVQLTLISDENRPSERLSAPRRQSRVFRATVDNQPAVQVVKLARVDKIERESKNYEAYVRYGLKGQHQPVKLAEALLWDVGAVVYSYVDSGNGLGAPGGPQIFTNFYRATPEADLILKPLTYFFAETWDHWYQHDVQPLHESLFDAYNKVWNNALESAIKSWQQHPELLSFPELKIDLPNPGTWVAEHRDESALKTARQGVTHGDLHGDNLFVTTEHAFPIDFERTGQGPILRDFVELIEDIVIRIARLELADIRVFYELIVALCTSRTPAGKIQATDAILHHPEARKALFVVRELEILAKECTRFVDQQEYLWGLLLNNLFIYPLLPEGDFKRTKAFFFAAVICTRLEQWDKEHWLPTSWPSIEFLNGNQEQEFADEVEYWRRELAALETQLQLYEGHNIPPHLVRDIENVHRKLRELGAMF